MFSTINSLLIAATLIVCSSPGISQQITRSGAPLPLDDAPGDLAAVDTAFTNNVLPQNEQGDMTLRWSLVQFPSSHTGNEDFGRQVVSDEMLTISDRGADYQLERFHAARLWQVQSASRAETIVNALFAMNAQPYFCQVMTALRPAGNSASCRRELGKLLSFLDAVGDHRAVYLVEVEGNWWGADRNAVLYIASIDQPEAFVRIEFDVLHEI